MLGEGSVDELNVLGGGDKVKEEDEGKMALSPAPHTSIYGHAGDTVSLPHTHRMFKTSGSSSSSAVASGSSSPVLTAANSRVSLALPKSTHPDSAYHPLDLLRLSVKLTPGHSAYSSPITLTLIGETSANIMGLDRWVGLSPPSPPSPILSDTLHNTMTIASWGAVECGRWGWLGTARDLYGSAPVLVCALCAHFARQYVGARASWTGEEGWRRRSGHGGGRRSLGSDSAQGCGRAPPDLCQNDGRHG